MHVLVIGRPKFPVSPEELPTLIDGSLDWHERVGFANSHVA